MDNTAHNFDTDYCSARENVQTENFIVNLFICAYNDYKLNLNLESREMC